MIYGYIRVSTQTQAEKGYGLEDQAAAIRKYCTDHGLELQRIYKDAGISGNVLDTEGAEALTKRQELMELFGILEDGDTVIVLNTSRLWRSDNAKVLIRRELLKLKVKVISIEQPSFDLYTVNPNDRLINGMMELLDEWERWSISRKLARGRTVKAKGGDKPSGVTPTGYRYTADKKGIEINPEEAAMVREMFTEGQKGQSLSKIAKYLNAKGYKTRRGRDWSAGSVHAILRNRFYIGELQHQGQTIQGNHTPLISRVQFGKVQAQLKRHRHI